MTEFMKAVKRNVLKGFRCQLGDNFLTVYPNLQLSVKDTEGRWWGMDSGYHRMLEEYQKIKMED